MSTRLLKGFLASIFGVNSTTWEGSMKKTSKSEAKRAKITTLGRIAMYRPMIPPTIMRIGKKAAMVVETDASTGANTSRLPSSVPFHRELPFSK